MPKRSKIETLGLLPRGVKEQILELDLNKNEKERLLEFMVIIVNNYIRKEKHFTEKYAVPMVYIKRVLTNRYTYLFKYLLDSGIITRYGKYHVRKCYKYIIHKDFAFNDLITIEYKRTSKTACKSSDNNINKIESVLCQYAMDMLAKIEIEDGLSIECIVENRRSEIETNVNLNHARKSIKIREGIAKNQIANEKFMFSKIQKGIWRASRNNTNNRLDTNLTNIPSVYIKSLLFDGGRIISLDIKNSQFVILANIILRFVLGIDIEGWVDISIREELESYRDRIMWYHKLNNEQENDISAFTVSAIKGTLYTDFMVCSGISERSVAKKAFFKILFGNEGKFKSRSELRVIFENCYPSVYNSIVSFKENMISNEHLKYNEDTVKYIAENRKGAKKKGYTKVGSSYFVNMLAKMESFIMIDKILPKFKEAGLSVLTKHDSILVPENQAGEASKIFFNELQRYLPFGFTIEQEIYGQEPVLFQYNPLLINEPVLNIAS